jgi:hypothetical protein
MHLSQLVNVSGAFLTSLTTSAMVILLQQAQIFKSVKTRRLKMRYSYTS